MEEFKSSKYDNTLLIYDSWRIKKRRKQKNVVPPMKPNPSLWKNPLDSTFTSAAIPGGWGVIPTKNYEKSTQPPLTYMQKRRQGGRERFGIKKRIFFEPGTPFRPLTLRFAELARSTGVNNALG